MLVHSYSDPWSASAAERLSDLARGRRRILYYYTKPDTSTFRYRVYNMVQAVNRRVGGDDISATYFSAADADHFDAFVDAADVVVICRARYSHITSSIVSRARRNRATLLFDVDDLVFDTRYVHLVGETLDQDMTTEAAWDTWFASISRIGAVLRLCDGAITTNRFLADRIEDFAQVPARVVPNFLNDEQLAVSERIRDIKRLRGRKEEGTRLGYFSGTPTHNRDFRVLSAALADVMDEHPDVRLSVVGFAPSHEMPAHLRSRIDVSPLVDFINLQELIASVDINLVPLQDNDFTNCKSELKYFEAAVVGVPTLATPTYTYRAAIQDGINGLLVNGQDWQVKLNSTVSKPDGLAGIAAHATDSALADYSPGAQVTRIREATLSS